MRLLLIHQSPGAGPLPPDTPLWRTCLREVAFVNDLSATEATQPVVADADAYALLLEIVCGLRSPIVGETEVQAQFKSFLSSLDRWRDASLLRLGQRVLADAKMIRQRHLQGFGAHSYGPLAAGHVPADRLVVLIGTGALAAEIAGALEGRHRIDRWGRRAVVGREDDYLIASAGQGAAHSSAPATLIVAAPVGAADLAAVAKCYPRILEVIDLRAEDERTPFDTDVDVIITLDDLFADAIRSNAAPAARLREARHDILRLGEAYDRREELRPFGWDNLCV